MRIGILTGGGDCPGPECRHPRRRHGARSTAGTRWSAVRDGWRGLIEGIFAPLGRREVSGILPRGGTILGTTRTNPYKVDGGVERGPRALRRGTASTRSSRSAARTRSASPRASTRSTTSRSSASRRRSTTTSPATDYTFGFDTAVTIATEAIDRLHTTAESHNRVMVVEVMGRHTGWIAVMSGIAGGADVILIPEQPITVEDACAELVKRHERGKDFSIVVVSEGYELTYDSGEQRLVAEEARATDQFGHVGLGGVGDALAREIEERTGFETRVTVLGHVQRGGTPTPRDRVLATRFGLKAADLVARGPLRPHGRAARRRDRRRLARGGDARAEDRAAGVVRGRAARSSASSGARMQPVGPGYDPARPEWRNWQTRGTQNPVSLGTCGFDPHLRHSAGGDDVSPREPPF